MILTPCIILERNRSQLKYKSLTASTQIFTVSFLWLAKAECTSLNYLSWAAIFFAQLRHVVSQVFVFLLRSSKLKLM